LAGFTLSSDTRRKLPLKMFYSISFYPEGKRPLGRPRRRWEDGIRMDLGEIGLGVVDWIRLSQDRDRWRAVVCGDEPSGSCATELVRVIFLSRQWTVSKEGTAPTKYIFCIIRVNKTTEMSTDNIHILLFLYRGM
jgi:hypothetical protein